jgi:CheY-like chemotaxis protein
MTFTDHSPSRQLRALVLDHDGASALLLRRELEARSFSVISAADGASGLAILLEELLALDVLVVAADLPGRDARAFAELIRRAGGEGDLSIVVVGASSRRLEADLLAAGVDRVFSRTDAPDVAAGAIAAVVAARRNANAPRTRPEPPSSLELELEDPQAPTEIWSLPFRGMALLAS